MSVAPELLAHREWLGQIGPVGLVVSPNVLVKRGVFVDRQRAIEAQAKLAELVDDAGSAEEPVIGDPLALFRELLGWPDGWLAGAPGGPELPDSLVVSLPEYEDHLRPTYAVPAPDPAAGWLALVDVASTGTDLDKPSPSDRHDRGWRASPHARLERLLRDTGVAIGILFNGSSLRLVYAPRGESSGHLTSRFRYLLETQGRPMVGALCALLAEDRLRERPDGADLPTLLVESRKSQNDVSTELAGQVLEALWHLVRGFQRANVDSKGQLLDDVLREAPAEVYGGLLATIMRLVFVLYAEDRDVMPAGDVYQRHYSVSGLFQRLREDAARYPDTMDARFGAWAQLLALFRLIHDGGGHGGVRFVPRHGRLFNPDTYPFLEGRPRGSTRVVGDSIDPPRVSDGVVYRVLQNLLILDGERISYRALDVEQIGSVYEAMMGYELRQAAGPSVAVAPKHVVVNLADLLDQKGADRARWLKDQAELNLSSGDGLARATAVDDVTAALGKRISRYTPQVLPVGALYLQPTEERRRSGSHYTPRTLTEPIVRTTFKPILERLGDDATPDQVLDLKVCDPAMGSGAFLVEACRLLGDRLVNAWEKHKATPKVPDDEDVWTHARRLVAERCLYGVDKNIFAVDLAKLSLWLATLAREHPFTFLDHALQHGDSLVGLSREQIACLNWEVERQMPLLRTAIDARVDEAQRLREQIQGLATSDDVPAKEHLLRDAEESLADVRLVGDVVVAAFFEREKPKDRKVLRAAYAGKIEGWLAEGWSAGSSDPADREGLQPIADDLREDAHPIAPFHWQVEFPEVFTRPNGGFDVMAGNPPFAGKNTLANSTRAGYPVWLQTVHEESHGNADLVAHFYRRAFNLLRDGGAFGLIATNTIAQGDTRGTGLRWIRKHGGTIFAARKRIPWPGEAAVVVSVVHVAKGPVAAPYELDRRPVDLITAFLFHAGGDDDPARLPENAGKSFQGSIALGMGFTFDDTDKSGVANPISLMHELIRKNPRNAERIFPYIGGEEVNDSPTHAHHRYAINFEQMSEEECRRTWPDLMAIVEAKVKPERMKQKREVRAKYWWRYGEVAPALYRAIRGLERIIVTPRVSKNWSVTLLPTGCVHADSLVVVASDSVGLMAILQSRIHQLWAAMLGSSLEERPRYTPSDCFETFPFPDRWPAARALEKAGRDYFEHRDRVMAKIAAGRTETYNRFHDPNHADADIERLRELHDDMDRAVLDAYRWTHIRPTCEFLLDSEDDEAAEGVASRRRKPYRYRWPDEVRDEVLGRLLELNARRAEGAVSADAGVKSGRCGRRRAPRVSSLPELEG